jgi:hypothetical protein
MNSFRIYFCIFSIYFIHSHFNSPFIFCLFPFFFLFHFLYFFPKLHLPIPPPPPIYTIHPWYFLIDARAPYVRSLLYLDERSTSGQVLATPRARLHTRHSPWLLFIIRTTYSWERLEYCPTQHSCSSKGVCAILLRLYTSTEHIKRMYTSPQPIFELTYLKEDP